ncbi:MAG: hypothetical protein ACKD6O_08235 [Candidatus Bathyarchaeota archaeon]
MKGWLEKIIAVVIVIASFAVGFAIPFYAFTNIAAYIIAYHSTNATLVGIAYLLMVLGFYWPIIGAMLGFTIVLLIFKVLGKMKL